MINLVVKQDNVPRVEKGGSPVSWWTTVIGKVSSHPPVCGTLPDETFVEHRWIAIQSLEMGRSETKLGGSLFIGDVGDCNHHGDAKGGKVVSSHTCVGKRHIVTKQVIIIVVPMTRRGSRITQHTTHLQHCVGRAQNALIDQQLFNGFVVVEFLICHILRHQHFPSMRTPHQQKTAFSMSTLSLATNLVEVQTTKVV